MEAIITLDDRKEGTEKGKERRRIKKGEKVEGCEQEKGKGRREVKEERKGKVGKQVGTIVSTRGI